MTDVSPVSSVAPTNATAPKASLSSAASVDYDAFLQLLVAEMQNQDPTKPMESTEYVAQLASFSSVEQSIQINDKLDQMLNSSFITNAGSLIGRTVTTTDGTISGQVSQVRVLDNQGYAILNDGQKVPIDANVIVS